MYAIFEVTSSEVSHSHIYHLRRPMFLPLYKSHYSALYKSINVTVIVFVALFERHNGHIASLQTTQRHTFILLPSKWLDLTMYFLCVCVLYTCSFRSEMCFSYTNTVF